MATSKLKIIFTVTSDLSYDQRMQRICHSLATHGFDVLLVGRIKANSVTLKKAAYQQRRLKCWFEKGKFFYLEYNLRLFFLLLTTPSNIISSVDIDTLLACVLASKIRAKKCVFDAHEYFTEVPEVVNRPITKKIWTSLSNLLIPKTDLAYTVSASLQELFTELYKTPFHLIRNISVSTSNLAPKLINSTHPVILLYQGALNEGRGIEALLSAMQHLDHVLLWLVGEGDLSGQLRILCKSLQIEDKVKFWGYILPSELKELTPQASIGINILENKGLSYFYSLANKTFDYIHAGIPAIHPNFPEYRKLNEQYQFGHLVEDLSPETLLKAIHKLINDKAYYQKLQQNCNRTAKILNWENEENRLIELYLSL